MFLGAGVAMIGFSVGMSVMLVAQLDSASLPQAYRGFVRGEYVEVAKGRFQIGSVVFGYLLALGFLLLSVVVRS